MDLIATGAQVIVAGGLAGARPALTLFILQLFAALFAVEAIPQELSWIISVYAITAVGIAALIEHFARTDPDLDEVLAVPNKIIGTITAILISVLLIALRSGEAPPEEEHAKASLLVAAGLAALNRDIVLLVLAAVLAALSSLVVSWARGRVLAALDIMAVPGRFVRWLETGTVAGALALVLLLPVLSIVLAALLLVVSTAAGFLVRALERRRDELAREGCECGYAVRVEALVCPSCGKERTPSKVLSPSPASRRRG
jgi:hypothetical protein